VTTLFKPDTGEKVERRVERGAGAEEAPPGAIRRTTRRAARMIRALARFAYDLLNDLFQGR